jgi:hypothetical protein
MSYELAVVRYQAGDIWKTVKKGLPQIFVDQRRKEI